MIREQLIGAIAALEQYGSDPVNRHVGLQKLRAQLAALPEPPQPWTPRERRLREALGEAKCYIAMYRDEYLAMHGHISDSDKQTIEEDLNLCESALADTPPPDPRDEALEMAAQWLEAAANRCESILETSPKYHLEDDIQNYRKAAAIARAKGGR